MAINVPDAFFDKYYEAVDFFIDNDHIGRLCTVVYQPKRTSCVNCVIKPIGSNTTNVYRHGGPMPFSFGNCPLCGGNGFKETEYTDSIRLRIYWNRKDWKVPAGNIAIQDADVMVIGYMNDMPKVKRAMEIILVSELNENEYRTSLLGTPTPWGFGRRRYFNAFLQGVG
jgi:hypothetical protein